MRTLAVKLACRQRRAGSLGQRPLLASPSTGTASGRADGSGASRGLNIVHPRWTKRGGPTNILDSPAFDVQPRSRARLNMNAFGSNVLATARTSPSEFSRVIFCASMTSPIGNSPKGLETRPELRAASLAKLADIRRGASIDPVLSAGFAADHFEIPALRQLRPLRWRQPFPQEPQRSTFRRCLGAVSDEESPDRSPARAFAGSRPSVAPHAAVRSFSHVNA